MLLYNFCKEPEMTGIQFLMDERGQKTAAVIDLKTHKALWSVL